MEIGGHYTYYEKNPCMQNYMISSRKKNGAYPTETVEDRAAQDFRNLVRKRGEHQKGRKAGSLMYAASACLVLVLIVMGVSLINSFNRMQSVQNTLNSLAGETDNIEARETSGTATAVTEEQTGSGQDGQASDSAEDDSTDVLQDAADAKGADRVSQTTSDADTNGQAISSSGENGSDGVYIVEEGDTLAIISKKMYGDLSHVDAICKMNGIENGNLIYVGQKLILP